MQPDRSSVKIAIELSQEYALPAANLFHADRGNLHPLVLCDADKLGESKQFRAVKRAFDPLELLNPVTGLPMPRRYSEYRAISRDRSLSNRIEP